MAALHVSSLPPRARAKFVRTSFHASNMTMVVRFMAGLTKFQSQVDIQNILALTGDIHVLVCFEFIHWLFEAHDPDLVQKCMVNKECTLLPSNINYLDPFDCYALGYAIANSRKPWNLILKRCSINGECLKMLTVVEKGRAFHYLKSIDLEGNDTLGDEGAIVLGEHEYTFHSMFYELRQNTRKMIHD